MEESEIDFSTEPFIWEELSTFDECRDLFSDNSGAKGGDSIIWSCRFNFPTKNDEFNIGGLENAPFKNLIEEANHVASKYDQYVKNAIDAINQRLEESKWSNSKQLEHELIESISICIIDPYAQLRWSITIWMEYTSFEVIFIDRKPIKVI